MNVKVFDRPTNHATKKVKFAPVLTIPNGVTDVSFYEKAFGAFELRRFGNDDGSVHVAEFQLGEDTLFHLHESTNRSSQSPSSAGTTTVTIGLFVDDVDLIMEKAKAAGAVVFHLHKIMTTVTARVT
jgi:PhnB protein